MNYKVFIIFMICVFGICMCGQYVYGKEPDSYRMCFTGYDKQNHNVGCRDGDGYVRSFQEWISYVDKRFVYHSVRVYKHSDGTPYLAKVYFNKKD